MNDNQRDEILWQIAKKRTAFKWAFSAYVFVNAFLIAIWLFTTGTGSYFWPMWPMLGWGIGVLYQYLNAYQGNNVFTAEQEYERLKNQQHNKI